LANQDVQLEGARFLKSGDESGTAPEDRPFRPDVEGLRAVAVLLVVLFHSGASDVSGGYVGVDVFFVISGFVITGVLLRERASSGRTSILAFYGRRCRRIIPAATLVIIVTVFLSYFFLGVVGGRRAATDGRWAAVFLANFRFIATGTSYLGSKLPPSPLQNFWSLAVEEQFYVVYPTFFLVLAGIRTRLSLRAKLAIGLVAVIGISLIYSIVDTHNNPVNAYYSPFTRAWELALGALVAVCTPWLLKVPTRIAATATWLGLGAILFASCYFTAQTAYPGSLVTIPVVGAALIIAGGASASRFGVEALLRLSPFRGLGKLSYSLYLWHWPILIIAAEHGGSSSPSFPGSLGWDLLALGASVVTYVVVENPIRHARTLLRNRWASIGLGAALVAATLAVITLQVKAEIGSGIGVEGGTATGGPLIGPPASLQDVLGLVAASNGVQTIPTNLVPSLSQAVLQPLTNLGDPPLNCYQVVSSAAVPGCTFGDRSGRFTVVLFGDSHAGMWFPDIERIANQAHWRLVVLIGHNCAVSWYPMPVPGPFGGGNYCNRFHQFAIGEINRIDPNLLIVAQAIDPTITSKQWREGLEQTLKKVTAPKTAKLVIGNEPFVGGPNCLAKHTNDVQACSVPPINSLTPYRDAEKEAAAANHASYINVTPWFCARTCSSVIGNYDAYFNTEHIAIGYQYFLEGVLGQAIDLPRFERSTPER
jgi:peptidoglycan/LPS O-acetylase OafA/YrhL